MIRKGIIITVFMLLINSLYAQKNKWGIELMGVEKTNYAMSFLESQYSNDQNFDNYIFFQPDYNLTARYGLKKCNIKLGITYVNNIWKIYKSGYADVLLVYYQAYFDHAPYAGTRIMKEKSIIIPLSIEKKLFLKNNKKKWFFTTEVGLSYQCKYKIENSIKDFYNGIPNFITDQDYKTALNKDTTFGFVYGKEDEINRSEFEGANKKNKDMFAIFISNGIGYQFNKKLYASMNLFNRTNITSTKTDNVHKTKSLDGNVGLGIRIGVEF